MGRSKGQVTTKMAPLMGSTIMGERGQVVIPKAIRDKMKLESGTRLLVVLHDHGIAILPTERMHSMLKDMTDKIGKYIK